MFKVDLPTANFLNAISDADLFAETMKFNWQNDGRTSVAHDASIVRLYKMRFIRQCWWMTVCLLTIGC